MFLGFFHPFPNLSILPLILSVLVSGLFAVTIHSRYSFLFVNDRELKKSDSFLCFFNAFARSSGSRTSLVFDSTQLNISLSFGLASFFRSASVFILKATVDHVSSKEIRLIQ